MHRGGVMDAAPATASLLLPHRGYLRFRAERGRILARPSRWLPFADGSSNDMLDPERFLPQLSSETFLGEFMAASSSPTVRRRQLATELKRLRLAAKMTIEQVAEQLEWSPGKISKIENARVSVLPSTNALRLITLGGSLDGIGVVLYMYATVHGLLSISALLTSFYPAVTILCARVFLHERLSAVQLGGAALALIAVAAIALA